MQWYQEADKNYKDYLRHCKRLGLMPLTIYSEHSWTDELEEIKDKNPDDVVCIYREYLHFCRARNLKPQENWKQQYYEIQMLEKLAG